MVRPNFIPRTLRGVGGVRLFDIPGVIYPKDILVTKAGLNRKNGLPYTEPPPWGITSREAASILGCTPSSARTWLHRRKVPYRIVSEKGQTIRLFWRKERVVALAEQRLPVVKKCPTSLITSREALCILHVGRSSLHRYQERGQLRVVKVRYPSAKGLRKCSYFNRSDVERLAKYLEAMREKEEELRLLRRHERRAAPSARATPPTNRKNRKRCNKN